MYVDGFVIRDIAHIAKSGHTVSCICYSKC